MITLKVAQIGAILNDLQRFRGVGNQRFAYGIERLVTQCSQVIQEHQNALNKSPEVVKYIEARQKADKDPKKDPIPKDIEDAKSAREIAINGAEIEFEPWRFKMDDLPEFRPDELHPPKKIPESAKADEASFLANYYRDGRVAIMSILATLDCVDQ